MKHFGDYQTPISLVEKVYNILDSKGISFKHILEPTVGQGNFLIEGINRNPSLNSVVGIEIQEYYVNILILFYVWGSLSLYDLYAIIQNILINIDISDIINYIDLGNVMVSTGSWSYE